MDDLPPLHMSTEMSVMVATMNAAHVADPSWVPLRLNSASAVRVPLSLSSLVNVERCSEHRVLQGRGGREVKSLDECCSNPGQKNRGL